jgi:hypothetical protein
MTSPSDHPAERAPACKSCAYFSQTYKHDIETEKYAYQMGTCTAGWWVRGVSQSASTSVDRDSVRKCHATSKPIPVGPGFF